MIEGTFEVVLTVRIAVPPGQDPVEAGKQIANAGAMFPIGLVRFVKNIDVNVVPVAKQGGPKLHEGPGF